jgi:hypothetical protein
MRSDIHGTEIDRDLQTIVESMHPTAEIAAQTMAEDDDEQYNAPNITDPELTSGGDELVVNINIGDETHDGVNINIMDPVNVDLEKGIITFELDTGRVAGESSCNTNREGTHDAADEDKVKCPHCDKVIQASSCGNH